MSLAYTQTLDQKLLPCKRKQCCSPPPLSAKNIAKNALWGKEDYYLFNVVFKPSKSSYFFVSLNYTRALALFTLVRVCFIDFVHYEDFFED